MSRRAKSGKSVKPQRRKTLTRHNPSKAARYRNSLATSNKTNIAGLIRERDEALAEQAATSQVLHVISKSPGELEPVFQVILENATRICEAKFGIIYRYDNGAFLVAGILNAPPALAEYVRQRGPFQPPAGTAVDRLLHTRDVIYTADDTAEKIPV